VITDLELARLAGAIYDPASRWDREFHIADLRVGCLNTPDGLVVVPRGTVLSSLDNLRRDIECFPIEDPELGALHRGFYTGAMLFADAIDAIVGDRTVVGAGHSLGAAVLLPYLARRRARRRAVAYAATFGCPKLAFSLFGKPVRIEALTADIIGPDYAHERDPVVPEPAVGYRHGRSNPPLLLATTIASLDPFDYHAMAGYEAGLASPAPAAAHV
jgi:pimeloyl-ACP methyl ester carboxylesterase